MFISITDLEIPDKDDSTYFSVATIDSMQQPGETLKFDRNRDYELEQWIQQRVPQNNPQISHNFLTERCFTPLKLSRPEAIFEFHSSNPKISFNVNFECRFIELHRKD